MERRSEREAGTQKSEDMKEERGTCREERRRDRREKRRKRREKGE